MRCWISSILIKEKDTVKPLPTANNELPYTKHPSSMNINFLHSLAVKCMGQDITLTPVITTTFFSPLVLLALCEYRTYPDLDSDSDRWKEERIILFSLG